MQPIQLIYFDEARRLCVNPEAIEYLESLKEEKIGVLTAIGKYRTGKSFMLNRVILNKKDGFTTGPTINPCTKGLWIWPELVSLGDDSQCKVLILDTEGIGAFDEEENHDTKVFLLAMLLSSYFVYNSTGSIDEKAIQSLSIVVELGKHLQKCEGNPESLLSTFPTFLWLLRDFSLKLVDAEGNPISSKTYLENALKAQKGLSETVEAKNRIRRLLTTFFEERDCSMLVRPTENEKDLQNLSHMDNSELRPEFVEQVRLLRKKIGSRIKPKVVNSHYISGSGFVKMCSIFVEKMNEGAIPSIESTWEYICAAEAEKNLKNAISNYQECIEAIELPKSHATLVDKEMVIREKLISSLDSSKPLNNTQKAALEKEFNDIFALIDTKNCDLNKESLEHEQANLEEYLSMKAKKTDDWPDISNEILRFREKQMKYLDYPRLQESATNFCFQLMKKLSMDIISKLSTTDSHDTRLLQEKFKQEKSQRERESTEYKEAIEKLQEKNVILREEKVRKEAELSLLSSKFQEECGKFQNQINEQETNTNSIISKLESNIEELKEKLKCECEKVSNLESSALKSQSEFNTNLALEAQRAQLAFEENERLRNRLDIMENRLSHREKQKDKEEKEETEHMVSENIRQLSRQLEESNHMNKQLMETLQSKNNEKKKKPVINSLQQMNQTLTRAVERAEERSIQLQRKLSKAKEAVKILKYSESVVCKNCKKCLRVEAFKNHLTNCEEKVAQYLNFKVSNPGNPVISKAFGIFIETESSSWTTYKTFGDIRYLVREIFEKYPELDFPKSFKAFKFSNKSAILSKNKCDILDKRRNQISELLNDILLNEKWRNEEQILVFFDFPLQKKNNPEGLPKEDSLVRTVKSERLQKALEEKFENEINGNFNTDFDFSIESFASMTEQSFTKEKRTKILIPSTRSTKKPIVCQSKTPPKKGNAIQKENSK